jgi:phosphoribosyl-AMP cyclohydrolase
MTQLDFAKCDGLVSVIVQDADTRDVLMNAFMNEEAFEETKRTGRAVYWSRSRRKLWRKGEESGNAQLVREIRVDCDADSLLLLVEQVGGAACHDGYRSCYYRRLDPTTGETDVIGERVFDPSQVYAKKGARTMENLKFLLPNGSLSERLQMYLRRAGFTIAAPDRRGYCGTSGGIEFYQLDRRMVPRFIASGTFDAGITGQDLYLESDTVLQEIAELPFARASDGPSRWVLARKAGWIDDGSPVRIACELPRFAALALAQAKLPFRYEILRIDGSEEACVTRGLADMVLVVTESGRSLEANKLDIVPGCDCLFRSVPAIYARAIELSKRTLLAGLQWALLSVIGDERRAMVTFNIRTGIDLATLALPADKAPSVFPLADPAWQAVAVCIRADEYAGVLAKIKIAGAQGIVYQEIQGHLP